MKILLLGPTGQVGYELARCLPLLGKTVVAGGDVPRVDFVMPGALSPVVDNVRPDVIVNAAAYTAVDKAEAEVSVATAVNAEAPRDLAQAAARHNALLVHYSTDYVFAGDANKPYREDDPVAPSSVYGVSKAMGEHAISAAGVDHLIFRTAWVYAARGNNFLRSMLRLGAAGDSLRVVDDQRGSPTWARFLASATTHAIAQYRRAKSSSLSGIYHLTAGGSTTWFDYANYLFDQAVRVGLMESMPTVEPVSSDAYPTPAKRPAWSVLDNTKFESTFEIRVPRWQEGVDACLEDLALQRELQP